MYFSENLRHPLRLPVCVAPMFLVSGPDLVIASCSAGVIGSFPTPNARSVDQLRGWFEQITTGIENLRSSNRVVPIAPWAVNLVTHSTNSRLQQDLELVAEFKPPIVITALGSPKPAIPIVHEYGGIVVADVTNMTLARKAAAAGADGLTCVSAGAGGHTGSLSPFAFISAVREFFDGLLIVGGGIGDGWGIAGAIAAGADLAYLGTRFLPSEESDAAQEHKDLVVKSTIDGLVVSAAITGAPVSWLRSSLQKAGLDLENIETSKAAVNHDSNAPPKKRWKEIFAAGQGLDQVKQIEPVAAIVERLEHEFNMANRRMSDRFWDISCPPWRDRETNVVKR